MRATIVGISDGTFEGFSLTQSYDVDIKHLEDKMHEIYFLPSETKYIMEITKAIFPNKNTLLIEGFITDNKNVGKMALEINISYPFLLDSEKKTW